MLQKLNPKNKDLMVNINGQLVHRDKAGVSPFDSVVQGGDAVWEGLRLYSGRIFKLREHLDRLERSARALAIVDLPPREKIIEELKRTLTAEKIRCVEADLSPVDVYGAEEMFCTGTMGELAGVVKIDNRDIGDGKVGPMTKRLSELYAQRTANEGVQVVD